MFLLQITHSNMVSEDHPVPSEQPCTQYHAACSEPAHNLKNNLRLPHCTAKHCLHFVILTQSDTSQQYTAQYVLVALIQ